MRTVWLAERASFEPFFANDSIREKLSQAKVVGFDLDGTLVDSNAVKSELFGTVICEFAQEASAYKAQIEESFNQIAKGKSRSQVIEETLKNFTNLTPTQEKVKEISGLFTQRYLAHNLPLFDDTKPVLEYLSKKGYLLFISSTTPEEDLERSITRYGICHYFSQILGFREDFCKERHHLVHFAKSYGVKLTKMVFVGDGLIDIIAAKNSGSVAIAKTNGKENDWGKTAVKPDIVIPNLTSLQLLL